MTHICPACGKHWKCECPDDIIELHKDLCGDHDVEIACSEHCAHHLRALMAFLSKNMLR